MIKTIIFLNLRSQVNEFGTSVSDVLGKLSSLMCFRKDDTVTVETQKKQVEKKVEKKKEEPKDPPNIAFAKKLQSFLDKNQIKEAIDLFQSLPKELEKDIDFKILLAS